MRLNFRRTKLYGLQIYTIFVDFNFVYEGLFIFYIVYIDYKSILIQ